MAKNKSFNKLVAGTMTAAMVAGVVAPVAASAAENTFKDVPAGHWSEKAINDMAAKKIIAGQGDGTFGFGQNVTRAQVATFMVKAKGLEITSDAPSFSDVAGSMYEKFIATAEKNKVMAGLGNGKFGPEQELTRAQMAQILVNAYGFKADENNKKTFNDIDGLGWATAKSSIETLASLNIVSGKGDGKFDPNATVTREEAAQFIYNAMNYVPASTEVKADAVSATNSTTLTITGTNLNKLTKDDITVANNTVSSVTPAADGKTATVTLKDELVVDQTTKVTVKGADFDVTYKVEASTAAVDVATYDDDTAHQFVSIRVDGKQVTAQELINAGYTVKFDAFDSKAATKSVKDDLLKSDATGELNTNLASKFTIPTSGLDLYVKVTLTKGSEVVTSDLAKVTIKNLDLAADGITSARLVNYGTDGADATYTNDFYQNSSTLVTNETAKFDQIKVKSGSDVNEVTTGYTVKSSDDSVVSVKDGVLTAQGPGTATITVTYGGATYTKTFTVKNGKREATTVSTSANSVSLSSQASKTISVNLLDQYGDPMVIKGGNVTVEQSNPTVVDAVLNDSATDKSGDADLVFTGKNNGAGTSLVTFRNAAGVKIGSTTVKATVTANDTLAQYSLAADTDISDDDVTAINGAVASTVAKDQVSTDATLDLQSDKYLKINLKGLNSDGVAVSTPQTDKGQYTVKVDPSAPGVVAKVHEANGFLVVEAGTNAGTATITVTNNNDSKIVKTFKVTVESVGYNATGASLKNVEVPTYAKTLTYKDFLTYKEADKDPVISGITLTKTVAQPVRLDVTDAAPKLGSLYIDNNANGVLDAGDVTVGSVAMTTTGTIAAPVKDIVQGVDVASGDNGTVLFKVLDNNGNVVATKGVKVDF